MDPHRGFHRRLLNKRQGLNGVLGGLVPNSPASSTVDQAATTSATSHSTGNPLDPGGILTSLIGDTIPTAILPSLGPSSATTSSTPLTYSSSSSTGSTTTSTSSVQTPTSTSSTTSSSTPTPTSTSSTLPPPPTSTLSGADTVYTTSDGTSVVYLTSTVSTPSATAAAHSSSFLQNPSMEGPVFALVGIVVLVLVFIGVTWTLRRRRRARLDRDLAAAVTFDPSATDYYERQENSIEKRRLSGSSSGHGHGYGHGMQMQPTYAPPQEYHGPMGYGQYSGTAYNVPPNHAPYQTSSPAVPQPAAQGGANLTRKFSDRKPVPHLLPDPAYDPFNTHAPVPSQFYQQ